jgi:signal transduction histidine kinase
VSADGGDAPIQLSAGGLSREGASAPPSMPYRWVFALTVAFLGIAAVLRSVLLSEGETRLIVLVLLAAWFVLMLAAPFAARVWAPSFVVYLVVQACVIFPLLFMFDGSDFFALLFAVPTMQAAARWRPRAVAVLIGCLAVVTLLGLLLELGTAAALAMTAVYTAVGVLFAAYTKVARRAVEARARNEALAADLRITNQRLTDYAAQAERLGAARERQRLARDLHDSVTQTLFGMTLTVRSALLLLGRASGDVAAQLDQLDGLTHSALEEMKVLGDASPPAIVAEGGLIRALERHCTERKSRDRLTVTLESDGDDVLPVEHQQALLRIVQEGLNNVVKHSGTSEAVVHVRLDHPCRLVIEDRGQGFDAGRNDVRGLGLTSMRERAAEIGWRLTVTSTPGGGTRVVAEEATGERGRDRG